MGNFKKPIHRSLLMGGFAFICFLCLVLSILSYSVFSSSLYTRYDDKLNIILNYVESRMDKEDIKQCIQTGVPSEKYMRLQEELNSMVDIFELTYLYTVIPVEDETGTMINVISATSEAERAAGEEDMPLLEETDAYPLEEIRRFVAAWNAEGISYIEESSDYGSFYTGCKPLRTDAGETIALICADIPIDELHRVVNTYTLTHMILTIVIGMVFVLLLILWLRRNVTGPVLALERSALSFAEKSHGLKDPSQLTYDAPTIRTDNEVASLGEAITRMSLDMRDYVQDILSAEERAKSAEQEAEGMSRLAYQDSLTHVKSKAAYHEKLNELSEAIAHQNARFAILIVDLNHLKSINDQFGHEKGDQYIIGACRVICDHYKYSPVYRIGGDEFVVILEGQDYDHADQLFQGLRSQFLNLGQNTNVPEWERYSAASGMAVYDASLSDETVDSVFRRADESMYKNKQEMKSRMV